MKKQKKIKSITWEQAFEIARKVKEEKAAKIENRYNVIDYYKRMYLRLMSMCDFRLKLNGSYAKKCYYLKCWYYTMSNDLTVLDNYDKRGFTSYHIDHIIPISYGYKNNVDPKIIGSISNLRMLKAKDNMLKGKNITADTVDKINELIIRNI